MKLREQIIRTVERATFQESLYQWVTAMLRVDRQNISHVMFEWDDKQISLDRIGRIRVYSKDGEIEVT